MILEPPTIFQLETTEPLDESAGHEQLDADEAFDEDDAKRGKNSQDFEEEEEEGGSGARRQYSFRFS